MWFGCELYAAGARPAGEAGPSAAPTRMQPRDAHAPRRLFLLDGHSLAYRAFFALPATLATSTGQVTNAVYGFTSMLIKLLGDEHPDLPGGGVRPRQPRPCGWRSTRTTRPGARETPDRLHVRSSG